MLYRMLQATGSHDGALKGEPSGPKESFIKRNKHHEDYDGSLPSLCSPLPEFGAWLGGGIGNAGRLETSYLTPMLCLFSSRRTPVIGFRVHLTQDGAIS